MTRRPLIGVLTVLAALLLGACGDSDGTTPVSTADTGSTPTTGVVPATSVSGRALPTFESADNDPAVGSAAPMVVGIDLLDGQEVSVSAEGRPLVIGFFAHWCPHCQREVDELTTWLETNDLPDGVDLMAVSTLEDASRDNHPPADWLSGEGWQHPVVADTEGFAAAEAFGVNAVPFWVFVDAEGNVAGRISGNLGPEQLVGVFAALGG